MKLSSGLKFFLLLAATAKAAPDWNNLKPGHWAVVSENTIRDLDPCPQRNCSYSAVEGLSGVINDWCGGAFASGYGRFGGLVVWGGGHNGYFGSEIYVFDLDSGRWVRVTDPYDDGSSSVAASCNEDGIYPDGSACPTHTYDQVEYHPATNRFVIIGGTPDPVCGGCVDDRVHLFDFDDRTWHLGARKPSPLMYAGVTGYDPARDAFWLLSAYTRVFSRYDPVTDAWTEYGAVDNSFEIDGAGVVDPVRDLFLFLDSRGSGKLYAIALEQPTSNLIELATEGDREIQSLGAALGFEYVPQEDCLVAWYDSADVYVLRPPEGDWRAGAWRWTRVPPDPANNVTPRRNPNGTYGRFRYAASVNAFVLVSAYDGPVWAYRLTPGAGTGPNPDGGVDAGDGGYDAGVDAGSDAASDEVGDAGPDGTDLSTDGVQDGTDSNEDRNSPPGKTVGGCAGCDATEGTALLFQPFHGALAVLWWCRLRRRGNVKPAG
jgi:hypothetical protein